MWHVKHGKYYMLQWGMPIAYSLGIHIDHKFKYIDFHLLFIIITLGNMKHEYEYYQAWWSSRTKEF